MLRLRAAAALLLLGGACLVLAQEPVNVSPGSRVFGRGSTATVTAAVAACLCCLQRHSYRSPTGSLAVRRRCDPQAPGYNCPRTCVPPNCYCASHDIPGGLEADKIPQFVVLVRAGRGRAQPGAWQRTRRRPAGGGLPSRDAPCPLPRPLQTNDDAITVTTMPVITDITSKHRNPNNCEIPAT